MLRVLSRTWTQDNKGNTIKKFFLAILNCDLEKTSKKHGFPGYLLYSIFLLMNQLSSVKDLMFKPLENNNCFVCKGFLKGIVLFLVLSCLFLSLSANDRYSQHVISCYTGRYTTFYLCFWGRTLCFSIKNLPPIPTLTSDWII